MNNRRKYIMKKISALFLLCAVVSGLLSCLHEPYESVSDIPDIFQTFRDIPDITAEEIAAVEALLEEYDFFVYGMVASAEAFTKDNGETGGFAELFCGWLTEFFGISFRPEIFIYEELFSELESHEIDFAGIITFAEPQLENCYITEPITNTLESGDVYPLVFNPLLMATANRELEPVISAVTKALRGGAGVYLNYLHNRGIDEYNKFKFIISLDEEEKAYLQNTVSVPLAVQYFNYPIVFYNQYEKKWDGITFDLIREIEKITGLVFEAVNDEHTEMADLMAMLYEGRAHMISDLILTEEREPYFIWGDYKFMSDQFALLSKIDFANVELHEIPYMHVALIKNTAHAEMFRAWFPDNSNTTEYENADDAFLALEKGEVDMVMAAKTKLLYYSNYYEFSGYKANYLFNHFYMSAFAFNNDYPVLRSVIDKALLVIDTDRYVNQWTTRTYDYRARILLAQRPWLMGAVFLSVAVIILILLIFYFVSVNRKTRQQSMEKAFEAEIAEKNNEAKTKFLATISHEIRTPMNAIIGMTELALRTGEPEIKNDYISTVKQSGENLLSIINDVLDFSKIDKGRLEIIPSYYSVPSFINDLVNMIKIRVLDSRVRFAVNTDSSIPKTLFGDETRIRQVALNLLSNAVKYTKKGFVSFRLYYDNIDENTINLIIEVTDSGIGIKQEDMDRLFTDYTQFDLEKNKGIEGIGLGLSITNSIIKAMNGTISVKSIYGKGSTFTVTVPQNYYTRDALAAVENPQDKSVLLFERRDVYADSILSAVSNLGISCTLAASDSELYEKLLGQMFDFLFISFMLYKKNEEVILKLGNNIKIVVLTEFGETVPEKDINILAMPAYSITIADILNGYSKKFKYIEINDHSIGFTAPEAKVLVVDDINTNLKVAKGLLMPYNIQIDLCKSGAEAIEVLQSQKYDLIFMDHKMPEMDGFEVVRRIREMGDSDPYFKDLPIAALTAEAIFGIKEKFLESGFNDFLSKPIDTVKLNSILEKWIPKEKQTEFVLQNKEDIAKIIEIDGVDVKRGIKLSGGKFNLYSDALAAFCTDAFEKAGEIKACFEKGDIFMYTIYVHGIKGAAAIIGAAELSESAKALETAGNNRDLVYIETHTEKFLQDLEIIIGNINNWLKISDVEESVIDIELLRYKLGGLKLALELFEAGAMHRLSDNLLELTQGSEVGVAVNKISDSILTGEYSEASALIEILMRHYS